MAERQGLIFDIQGFSVHDGPGCRTLVFLNGCPLRCVWCANPEGLKVRPQILYSRQKCQYAKSNCRRCLNACPNGAVTETGVTGAPLLFDFAVCDGCAGFDCARACPHEGARVSGKYKSVSEVMKIFLRDRQYWGDEGGVSFSGGEPLLQHEFLIDLLTACKKEKLHTAIETTAFAPADTFMAVMRHIDFAFIDVKHMDSARHQEKTGVLNERILANIAMLAKSGWSGRAILRMPVVPGFNDSLETAEATAEFMNSLNLFEINLLPFHRLGSSKWEQMGKKYEYADISGTPEEILERLQELYLDKKIACYVGDDVMY